MDKYINNIQHEVTEIYQSRKMYKILKHCIFSRRLISLQIVIMVNIVFIIFLMNKRGNETKEYKECKEYQCLASKRNTKNSFSFLPSSA